MEPEEQQSELDVENLGESPSLFARGGVVALIVLVIMLFGSWRGWW